MSNVVSFKKKLLASLCAFASGVGGASAVMPSVPAGPDDVLLAPLTRGYDPYKSVFKLQLDNNEKSLLDAIKKLANYGGQSYAYGYFSFIFNLSTKFQSIARDMSLGVRFGGDRVTFAIWMRTSKASTNNEVILKFSVDTAYIAKKLSERAQSNADGNIKLSVSESGYPSVNDSEVRSSNDFLTKGGNVLKCMIMNILFNDILGFDFKFYSDQSNAEYNPESALGNDNHPDIKGCWEYFIEKELIPLIDGVNVDGEFDEGAALATRAENDDGFGVDRNGIFNKFFGDGSKFKTRNNVEGSPGSDYYRSVYGVLNPAPATTPPAQVKLQMSTKAKVGMWILGMSNIGAVSTAAYLAKKHLVDSPKMQADYEMQLEDKDRVIKSNAKKADNWDRVVRISRKSSVARDLIGRVKKRSGTGAEEVKQKRSRSVKNVPRIVSDPNKS